MGMGAVLVWQQDAFRVRDDTADSNEDAGWLAALNTNWTQVPDVPFRVRATAQLQTGVASGSVYMGLYYSLNGGTWTYADNAAEVFTTDSIIHCIESTNVAGYVEDTDTTFLLGSADTLHTPNKGIVESQGFSTNTTWTANLGFLQAADFEWCLTLRSEFVSPGDTIGLRMYYNDLSFDVSVGGGYTQDMEITVGAAGNTGSILKIKGDALRLKGSSLIIK